MYKKVKSFMTTYLWSCPDCDLALEANVDEELNFFDIPDPVLRGKVPDSLIANEEWEFF